MESGRIPPSGTGTQNTETPDQHAAPEPVTTSVQTSRGQTVAALKPDKVSPQIPRSTQSNQRLPLHTRTITRSAAAPGLLSRAISFIRNRPSSSQRSELRRVFNHLQSQITKAQSATNLKTSRNHFTVNRNSSGFQVCAMMVTTGLARFTGTPRTDDPVRIRFVKPENFSTQVRAMEALIACDDLQFAPDGTVDWSAAINEDKNSPTHWLQKSGLLNGEPPKPVKGWFLNPTIIGNLEKKTLAERQLQALTPQQPNESEWDIARRRMLELGKIADGMGMEPTGMLLRDHVRRLSLLEEHQWQDIVERVRDAHPRLADELVLVTPPFAGVLQPDTTDVPLYREANRTALKKSLQAHELLDKPLTLAQVQKLEAQGDINLGYPLLDSYRTSVMDMRKAEMTRDFKQMSLPKTTPVDLQRMQSGLGRLRQQYPDIYDQCVDDRQRTAAIAKAKARVDGEADDKKVMLRESNELKQLYGSLTSTELIVPDWLEAGDESAPVTKDTNYMAPKKVLAILEAYDRVDAILKSTDHSSATLEELSQIAIDRAFQDGVSLSSQDWFIGVGKTPRRPWIQPVPKLPK